MSRTRRLFLLQCSALALSSSPAILGSAQASGKSLPEQNTFQSGDLLWPKKPDSFIPYNSGDPNSPDRVREQWEKERAEFIKSISQLPQTEYNKQLIARLRDLTFDQFHAYYTTGLPPGTPAPAGNVVGVGHVAIVDRRADGIELIEAMPNSGVRRLTYDQWLAGRQGEKVWHGRVRNFDQVQRVKIVDEAKRFLTRPYQFWNFRLDDDSAFYCSKLVWLSVKRALGVAVDNNADPNRTIWLSPKQVLNAAAILPLFVPDFY